MSDTFEQLRIIASDGGRLDTADRVLIAHAADELENVCRLLLVMQAELIESQQRRLALNERLIELQRLAPFTPAMWATRIEWARP